MKLKLFKQEKKLPVYNEDEKPSFFQKVFNAIENFFEGVVGDRKFGQSIGNFLGFIKFIFLALVFVTLFNLLIGTIRRDGPRNGESMKPELQARVFAVLLAFVGAIMCLGKRPAYEKTRHFADISVVIIICYSLSLLILTATFLQTGTLENHAWDLACVLYSFVLVLFVSFSMAQRSVWARFNPTKDNHLFIKTTSTSRDTGILRILESSTSRITIENIGSEAVDISQFKICRLSIDFSLPRYSLQPGQQIELIPEGFLYDLQCVRVPRIHCFGLTDRACTVTTVIFRSDPMDKKGCGSCDSAHSHVDTVAELTVRYRNELRWANESEF